MARSRSKGRRSTALISVTRAATVGSQQQQQLAHALNHGRTLWSAHITHDFLSLLSKDEIRQQEALYELPTTGASFLEDLQALYSQFVYPIAVSQQLLSRAFVYDSYHPMVVVDIVREPLLQALQLYAHPDLAEYCANLSRHMSTAKQLRAQCPPFGRYCLDVLRAPTFRNLDLADYMITPMQRETKLPLLIHAILKDTSTEESYYETLQSAETITQQCVAFVNKFSGAVQGEQALDEAMAQLDVKVRKELGFSLYDHYPRRLLHVDKGVIHTGRRCMLFLLSDMLLLVVRSRTLSDVVSLEQSDNSLARSATLRPEVPQDDDATAERFFIVRKLWLWTTQHLNRSSRLSSGTTVAPGDTHGHARTPSFSSDHTLVASPTSASVNTGLLVEQQPRGVHLQVLDHVSGGQISIEFDTAAAQQKCSELMAGAIASLHGITNSTLQGALDVTRLASLSSSAHLESFRWTCASRLGQTSYYLLGSDVGLWYKDTSDQDASEVVLLDITAKPVHYIQVIDEFDLCITIEGNSRTVIVYQLQELLEVVQSRHVAVSVRSQPMYSAYSMSVSTLIPRALTALTHSLGQTCASHSSVPASVAAGAAATGTLRRAIKITRTKMAATVGCSVVHFAHMFEPPTPVLLTVSNSFTLWDFNVKKRTWVKRTAFYFPIGGLTCRDVMCRTNQILLAIGDRFAMLDTKTTAITELSNPSVLPNMSLDKHELEALAIYPLDKGYFLVCYRACAVVVTSRGKVRPNSKPIRYTHMAMATSLVPILQTQKPALRSVADDKPQQLLSPNAFPAPPSWPILSAARRTSTIPTPAQDTIADDPVEHAPHYLIVYGDRTIECWDVYAARLMQLRPMQQPFHTLDPKQRLVVCGRGEWLTHISVHSM
ncbi:hypothetical protein RI367_006392 [Sorochytrium milnesiophthora]